MARGRLRVYLGAAPGVGKTYDMLNEGRRRLNRGTDVVIGVFEDHGRILTSQAAQGLEVVPRKTLQYRGSTFTEMDIDAVLARRPQVALVDELAHTNIPGSRNAKRWQDIEALLEAGIDVVTTVNVQHLESLNDVVESITGITQRETVPDDFVRRADQIELVDISPEALRRRMAHGNIYPGEKIDAALSNYFRVGNLTALRELALLWVADRVEEGLERYRADHGIDKSWPARERIVVALTGSPEGETLIRRGARIAGRKAGRDLMAVHVMLGSGLTGAAPEALAHQRALVEELGGTFHTVVGDDVATALLDFARGVNASQLVIGTSRRGRWSSILQPWHGDRIVRESGDIDVHVVTHSRSTSHRAMGSRRRPLSRARTWFGWGLALLGPILLTVALAQFDALLATDLMLFLTLAVAIALVGGLWPALFGAVLGSLLLNYYFTPPVGTFTIAEPQNALALVIFVVVAVSVASVVNLSARKSEEAARASAEASALSALAGDIVRTAAGLPALLARLRESFGLESVALLQRTETPGRWATLAASGPAPCDSPDIADATLPIDDDHILALKGHTLNASDRRVADAFAAHALAVLERDALMRQAEEAKRLAAVDALRTSILAALSHDLRTPLAGIKAGISSLRQTDVEWTAEQRSELMATVEDSADRLNVILTNLLDLSRLQTGAVRPLRDEVDIGDVVSRAVKALPPHRVDIAIDESVPPVIADGGLLERVVANVIENAERHSPQDSPVRVSAAHVGDRVQLQVSDSGPGVPDSEKQQIFRPFQRLGDAPDGDGIGLGLAVARGFAEALGGTLEAEDTPGGGLTMVLSVPAVELPMSRSLEDAVDEL